MTKCLRCNTKSMTHKRENIYLIIIKIKKLSEDAVKRMKGQITEEKSIHKSHIC